jgi:hypothetical protein
MEFKAIGNKMVLKDEANALEEAPETPEENNPTPAPKKRGRKSRAEIEAAVERGELPASALDRSPPAKRGRKPKQDSAAVEKLAKSVQGLHSLAALLTGMPELEISEADARAVCESVGEVGREFGAGAVSPKTLAILGLIGTLAFVYAPIYVEIRGRIRASKAKQVEGVTESTDAPTDVKPEPKRKPDMSLSIPMPITGGI